MVIGGIGPLNGDFLPQKEQDLIDLAKPDYSRMLPKASDKKHFTIKKKKKFMSCVYQPN